MSSSFRARAQNMLLVPVNNNIMHMHNSCGELLSYYAFNARVPATNANNKKSPFEGKSLNYCSLELTI